MNIEEMKNMEFKVPINISKSSFKKYEEVIGYGYAKYVYAIAICGGGCMLSQFIDLISAMDEANLSHAGYKKRARILIDELERLGFIETGYLNRYKYIILKHPGVALAEGDYKTHRRVSTRELFKSDRFTQSITKMQVLLDYGFVYQYMGLWEQLVMITRNIKAAIIKSRNIKGYDLELIDRIIESGDYKEVSDMLESMPEHENRLGPVRLVWNDLACLFRKLPQKGCLVASEPFYLKVFVQNDGTITLHYAPMVVIYDTMKDTEFYEAQNTFLTNGFYGIMGNNTLGMKDNYRKGNTLGFEHFNRIGYTIMLVGTNIQTLMDKKRIVDIPFDNGGIHSPMIRESVTYEVDIARYINHSNISNGSNKVFDGAVSNIEKTVGRLVSSVNEG